MRDARSIITLQGWLLACVAAVCLTWCAGCAPKLSGAWETVEVYPKGASFPFNRVEFDARGKYTSTGLFDAQGQMCHEPRTTTGEVRQSGNRIEFHPSKGTAMSYKARSRLDGTMEIVLQVPGRKEPLKAVLAPAGP